MDFVKIPYLPKGKVKLCVADIERDDMIIIKPCPDLSLPDKLKGHADLSFCYLGDAVAVCAKGSYTYYNEKLINFPITLIEGERAVDLHYPYDAAYNVAIVGKKLFCKKDTTDPVLLSVAEKMGYKIINIKQGYGKCSVCPVDENSAISADMSFYKAAKKEGIETLLITNDTIVLPGYTNGFFGGCAYMTDEKTFCTKGDINTHPDSDRIKDFLYKRNIKIEGTEGNLFDFGSFIPLLEE